jgi:exodeoxyribonuclease V beta subunit
MSPVARPGLASPMAAFPGGTAFGTLVHRVLEAVDTSAPDLAAEVLRRTEEAVARRSARVDPRELAAAVVPVLETPLGPLAGGRRLRDVARPDRLAELEFELPLAGGSAPTGAGAHLRALAELVRRHVPPPDPLAGLADQLDGLGGDRLRGYLTGSIDAVLRCPAPDTTPRHLVVDYKTNRVGNALTAQDYGPAALADSMLRSGYGLQALLYAVALHRYLRWRQPAYDPAVHLGGVLYLYLRGMCGPSTPVVDGMPCGVFAWRPPTALVVEASQLLDGGSHDR